MGPFLSKYRYYSFLHFLAGWRSQGAGSPGRQPSGFDSFDAPGLTFHIFSSGFYVFDVFYTFLLYLYNKPTFLKHFNFAFFLAKLEKKSFMISGPNGTFFKKISPYSDILATKWKMPKLIHFWNLKCLPQPTSFGPLWMKWWIY